MKYLIIFFVFILFSCSKNDYSCYECIKYARTQTNVTICIGNKAEYDLAKQSAITGKIASNAFTTLKCN